MIKKRIIKIVAFAAIFLVLFTAVSEGMVVTDLKSLTNIKGFYKEPENSLDVVMIGPSEMYTGYCAPMAWEEYGYTSYALAVGGVPGNLYKSMLKETLREQDPKVVVFELNGFIQQDDYYERAGKLHTWIDNIPWSENKIETIQEIIPEEERYSYYFKIATYHENWKQLSKVGKNIVTKLAIWCNDATIAKGFGTITSTFESKDPKDQTVYFTEKSQQIMADLLDTCKEEGVENVLFIRFPHGRGVKNPEVLDEAAAFVESYGYQCLNLNNSYEEIGLDLQHDFYNVEHLNVYGMEKMTHYLGEYITKHYDVTSEHSKEQCEQWDYCAQQTSQMRQDCKADIDQGIRRSYSEISFYFPPRNKLEKQSKTEYYMERLKQAINCFL